MTTQTLGPYRIEKELGAGGMGTVYLATVSERTPGIETGAQVALKVVHPHLLEQRGFFKRFLREAELGKTITHANVVRTYDADQVYEGGGPKSFLVMEYVEGQTLRELQEEIGRVPEELCRHIGREIAKALVAIHAAGIVHRDLKPDNALITKDEVVKVMDLGVARLAEEAIRLSQTGAFVGSVLYASPEQFSSGGAVIDGRSDLYALGLTLYELATGQHPFADDDLRIAMKKQLTAEPRRPSEVNPQLTPFFEEVLTNLLEKKRDARIETAELLLAVLDEGEDSEWWKERAQAIRTETRQPLRRIRIARETALYGRDEELEQLRALFAKAKAGEGQVLLVEGEAGIGKTRLVDEFVGKLQQEGEDLNYLFGSYPPGGAATAAGAFSTAYREHFGDGGLEETLQEYLSVTPSLIPAFAALLLGEAAPEGQQKLTKDSLHTVFVNATRALASERPTVVLIDDLHYTPEDGRALFAALALAVSGHKVLLVGTTRRGLPGDWVSNVERLDHASRIGLHRLGPKDLTKLLIDAFRSERLAEELAFRIAQKSDGNPLFVFEIVRGLREGKFITRGDDGTWQRTQVIDDIRIPSSVMDLIDARIVELEEEDKDLLDVAACCGFEFDPGLVAEVLGLGRIPSLKRLGRIEKTQRLIRSVGRHFVFDHHQVREALYEGMPGMLREEYHAAIAEVLETRAGGADKDPSELPGGVALELCEHFLSGAQGERAVRYLDRALGHLEEGYLHAASAALIDRALSIPELIDSSDRIELLLKKAGRLNLLGNRSEQRAALLVALELAENRGDSIATGRVLTALGGHLKMVGQQDESYQASLRAIELLSDGEHAEDLRGALSMQALLLLDQGRYAEARESFQRTLQLGGQAHVGLGAVCLFLGQYQEARAYYDGLLEIARREDNRTLEAIATCNLGEVSRAIGQYGRARDQYLRAIQLRRESGNRNSESLYHCNLGETFTVCGDFDQARRESEAARALAVECGNSVMEVFALSACAVVAEQQRDLAGAEELHAEALPLARKNELTRYVAQLTAGVGRIEALRGRADEARVHFAEALALAHRLQHPDDIVLVTLYLAGLPGGDVAAALATFNELEPRLPHVAKMEARFLLWKATSDAAHLTEAHDLLTYLRDHAPEEYRDTILENVPLHRDIVAAWNEHGGG